MRTLFFLGAAIILLQHPLSVDAQTLDYGDLPSPYPTLQANNGARHLISTLIYLGDNAPEAEADGQPQATAKGDNNDGFNDEDGFNPSSFTVRQNMSASMPVVVTNQTATAASLLVFIDWNADGDFGDANEQATASVDPGKYRLTTLVPLNVPFDATTTQLIAVRIRLTTDSIVLAGPTPTGQLIDGEVEDYFIPAALPGEYDFGDLPDNASGVSPGVLVGHSAVTQPDYRTRLADGGPRHRINPALAFVNESALADPQADGESDAHASAGADGDDTHGNDDEGELNYAVIKQVFDPISARLHIAILCNVAVRNQTGQPAYLKAFLDANNDGDFDDAGETPLTWGSGSLTGSGPNNHPDLLMQYASPLTNVPTSADSFNEYGMVFALTYQFPSPVLPPSQSAPPLTLDTNFRLGLRLRLSSSPGLGPNGINPDSSVPDGEVEDYILSFATMSADYQPRIVDSVGISANLTAYAKLTDKNSDSRFYGYDHFVGYPYQSSADEWQLDNGVILQGQNPLVPASMMANFPAGKLPYVHSVRFGDGSFGTYWGCINIRDLSSYRAFMNQKQQTGEDSVPLGDTDGDGIANYYEYAFGSDPTVPGSVPTFNPRIALQSSSSPGGSAKYLVLPYLRRAGGTSNGANHTTPDAIYQPKASKDLLDWEEPIEPAVVPGDLPSPPPGYEWGAVRLPTPVDSVPNNKGFLRLGLSAP